MPATPELLALARAAASKHALDFTFSVSGATYDASALVCAVVEQESAWDAHAIRYEPGFRTRYVAPLGLPSTEEVARSISWGLMQVMGQVAREHGFTRKFLSALCEPAAGLDIGCAVLAAKISAALAAGAGNQQQIPRSARDDSSPGIGFSVEAQGFSPAINDGPVVPTLLPQALAQDAGPKREKMEGQGIPLGEAHIARALEFWNGGANPDYAAQVLARLPHYK